MRSSSLTPSCCTVVCSRRSRRSNPNAGLGPRFLSESAELHAEALTAPLTVPRESKLKLLKTEVGGASGWGGAVDVENTDETPPEGVEEGKVASPDDKDVKIEEAVLDNWVVASLENEGAGAAERTDGEVCDVDIAPMLSKADALEESHDERPASSSRNRCKAFGV